MPVAVFYARTPAYPVSRFAPKKYTSRTDRTDRIFVPARWSRYFKAQIRVLICVIQFMPPGGINDPHSSRSRYFKGRQILDLYDLYDLHDLRSTHLFPGLCLHYSSAAQHLSSNGLPAARSKTKTPPPRPLPPRKLREHSVRPHTKRENYENFPFVILVRTP